MKVNVLYRDGSVQAFENEPQQTAEGKPPWASIPADSFLPFPNGVLWALDRIFVAADYSYVNAKPWLAPIPLPIP